MLSEPRARLFFEGATIEFFDQIPDRGDEFFKAQKGNILEPGKNPALHQLHTRLDFKGYYHGRENLPGHHMPVYPLDRSMRNISSIYAICGLLG